MHLSLAGQAIGLRRAFPAADIKIRPTKLVWTGVLTPTPLSRDYTVRITYSADEYPTVVIMDPPLQPDADGLLPHLFRDGSLCLHKANEWDGSMLIVDTIVPWAAEWLAHYELWTHTGQWCGDDDPAATASPGAPEDNDLRNRAERRRHRQADARRARRARSPRPRLVARPDRPVAGPHGDQGR